MDAVVGLGSAGCAIADCFSQYPQYEIYKIDTEIEAGKNNFAMPHQISSELYERECPDMTKFFKNFDENTNVTFVMSGGGKIAGASLRVLEAIKNCNINILYITPDISLMGGRKYILNRISFHVLQEYARSGLFEKISLIYNPAIESIIGDVPVKGYYDNLNEVLASTVHMVNVFSNTEPVFDNVGETEEHHRICSYGIINPETGEENLLFPLDNVREKVYYIGISKNALSDGSYFKELKSSMRKKAEDEDVKISFQINETKYDENYAYYIAYADETQNEKNLKNFLTKPKD